MPNKITKKELAKLTYKAMTSPVIAEQDGDMIIKLITKAINNQKNKTWEKLKG